MNDIGELREIAADVAQMVGREVAIRRESKFSWTTKSSSSDVVTEIDTWSEQTVVEEITTRRSNDGFLGEEGTSHDGTSGVTWVIDPVDGTTNLLYDIPGYSVSIAASIEGKVVAGAVFDPIRDELFSAARGAGATLDGTPISVSPRTELSSAIIGTGFSYLAERRIEQATQLVSIIAQIGDIRRMGGAALDLCAVACGRLDACYERGLSPWDSAAGALIASEAGADVFEGELTAASCPGITGPLFALLDEVGA